MFLNSGMMHGLCNKNKKTEIFLLQKLAPALARRPLIAVDAETININDKCICVYAVNWLTRTDLNGAIHIRSMSNYGLSGSSERFSRGKLQW